MAYNKDNLSDEQSDWQKKCRKLDVIASANGCKVVDYRLAEHKRKMGLIEEFTQIMLWVAVGFALAVAIKVSVLL